MNSKRTSVRRVSDTRGLPESVIDYDPRHDIHGHGCQQTPGTTYTGMDANRPPARHRGAWMPTDPRHDIEGHGCQQTPGTTYTGMDANRPPARHRGAWMPTDPQHDTHGHGCQQTPGTTHTGMDANRQVRSRRRKGGSCAVFETSVRITQSLDVSQDHIVFISVVKILQPNARRNEEREMDRDH